MSLAFNTHSYFWRHPDQLQALAKQLVRLHANSKLSIWSAGCAHGEEPYSLAFLLEGLGFDWEILATDIFSEALDKARIASYHESKMTKLPAVYRHQCQGDGRNYQVPERLRKKVTFRCDDLRNSTVEGHFSVVVCRNVLIYFKPEEQAQILSHLCRGLKPEGILVLGYSESSLLKLTGLKRLDDHGIFQKRADVIKVESPPLGPEVSLLSDALSSYARGSLRQASELLDQSLEEQPHSPIGRYFKAMLDIEYGDFPSAQKNLRSILETDSRTDTETLDFLGHHGLNMARFQLTVSRVLSRLEKVT